MTAPKQTILVVDDTPMFRTMIRKELEAGGYHVIEAENGIEAITLAAVDSPPDLITLDIQMPKLDGFQTFAKLLEKQYSHFFADKEHNRIPVIFITGSDTIEDRQKGFKLGAANFISKPFGKGEILAAANKILRPDIRFEGMTVLLVEDDKTPRIIIADVLKSEGVNVIEAEDGVAAFEIMQKHESTIDLVITDILMPRMDGNKLCRKIRNELKFYDIPIIFITAVSEEWQLLEAFKSGAADYITKPFTKEELVARINVHLERSQLTSNLRNTIKDLFDANRVIKRMSVTDPLTECYNRGYLNNQLAKEIERTVRYAHVLSIALCDIDHFKKINDTYGHAAGDFVLKKIVRLIQSTLRNNVDWMARFGGEEFLIVLPETDLDSSRIAVNRLLETISKTVFEYDCHKIRITASFGICSIDHNVPNDGKSMERLLNQADKYLYSAKKHGRNRVEAGILNPGVDHFPKTCTK